jgi:hypothetical protein
MPAPASTLDDPCMYDASDIPRGLAKDRLSGALLTPPPEPEPEPGPVPFTSGFRPTPLPLPPEPSLSDRLRPAFGRFWLYACIQTSVRFYKSRN